MPLCRPRTAYGLACYRTRVSVMRVEMCRVWCNCSVNDRDWVVLDGSGSISRVTNVALLLFSWFGSQNIDEWTQLSVYDCGRLFPILGKFEFPQIFMFCRLPVGNVTCGCRLWSRRDNLRCCLGDRVLYVQFARYGLRFCNAVRIISDVVNNCELLSQNTSTW